MGTKSATAPAAERAAPQVTTALRTERLLSLDVFRGITIAAMILVNNPGSWHDVYWPLRHANWHGCSPADLIFPFFLFIVGVAITFSFGQRLRAGTPRQLISQIARRTVILFALGLFLNGFPSFDLSSIRIPGVLQRIALCYCAAAVVVLACNVRGQTLTAVGLLMAYWVLMKWLPVPGHPTGGLGPGRNLAAYVDRALMHGHLWRERWDPEGILSTFPAIATTLSGVLAGHWLRSQRSPAERVAGLVVVGSVAVVLGLVMDLWFPINKNLWTSSFVVFTSGIALQTLGACYWLIDIQGFRRWATPFVIYGTNPILAYVLSALMAKILSSWTIFLPDGSEVVLRDYLFDRVFLPMADPLNASLLYAITYVALWLGITAVLYRQRVFIKI